MFRMYDINFSYHDIGAILPYDTHITIYHNIYMWFDHPEVLLAMKLMIKQQIWF